MITIGEEVLILLLDLESGRLTDKLPPETISKALSGSLLMELALNHRIDTDLKGLFVVSPEPLDEPLLDIALEQITADPERRAISYWVRVFATGADGIVAQLTDQLVKRGILLRRRDRLLRFVGHYTLTSTSGESGGDVLRRIANILLSDEIPDPRDVMITALTDACGLWQHLLDPETFAVVKPRIKELAGIELIGQAVVREIAKGDSD